MKKKFKALVIAATLAVLCCICFASCSSAPTGKAAYDFKNSATRYGTDIYMTAVKAEIDSMSVDDFVASEQMSDYLLISVKDYGDIVAVLRRDIAPKTVEHIKSLVAEGFYDGTVFHRVIEDFMIQGGGCVVASEGSEDYFEAKETSTVTGEFTSNGFTNNLTHIRGVLSMARIGAATDASDSEKKAAYNSASSQFFIVHQTNDSSRNLNGDYATFGYVLAGMDVVDKIATCRVFGNANAPVPVEDIVITSITFVEPK